LFDWQSDCMSLCRSEGSVRAARVQIGLLQKHFRNDLVTAHRKTTARRTAAPSRHCCPFRDRTVNPSWYVCLTDNDRDRLELHSIQCPFSAPPRKRTGTKPSEAVACLRCLGGRLWGTKTSSLDTAERLLSGKSGDFAGTRGKCEPLQPFLMGRHHR